MNELQFDPFIWILYIERGRVFFLNHTLSVLPISIIYIALLSFNCFSIIISDNQRVNLSKTYYNFNMRLRFFFGFCKIVSINFKRIRALSINNLINSINPYELYKLHKGIWYSKCSKAKRGNCNDKIDHLTIPRNTYWPVNGPLDLYLIVCNKYKKISIN